MKVGKNPKHIHRVNEDVKEGKSWFYSLSVYSVFENKLTQTLTVYI